MRNVAFVLCLLFLLQACGNKRKNDVQSCQMYQVASFDYFASGEYDGVYLLSNLFEKADFGIGTVDGLDGEMYVRDGKACRITSSGEIVEVSPSAMLPFAMMCKFKPDTTFLYTGKIPVYKKIDDLVNDSTKLLAIEIKGVYASLTTRSVPKQKKPYKSLYDIIAHEQIVFHPENLNGTAVGYRIPARCIAVNPTGYHIHYVSEDGKEGGHILAFSTDSVMVSIQVLDDIELVWNH